jgi:hypothetical protein
MRFNPPSCSIAIKGNGAEENAMRALLYVAFVMIGGLLCVAIGYLVEPQVSMTMSLTVFLALFFTNFIVSWIAVVRVMNDSPKDVLGRQGRSDIETEGQEAMRARGDYPVSRSIAAAQNAGRRWISLI